MYRKRRLKKLSQKELGALTNLSRTSINLIENNKQKTSIETAKKLSEILDIGWIYFFSEFDEVDLCDLLDDYILKTEKISNLLFIFFENGRITINCRTSKIMTFNLDTFNFYERKKLLNHNHLLNLFLMFLFQKDVDWSGLDVT